MDRSRLPGPSCAAVVMEAGQKVLLQLCSSLEAVADSLPGSADPSICRRIALELEPLLTGLHRFEEAALFPAYCKAGTPGASLDRLREEHVADEGFAAEIAEALHELALEGRARNPEALGFMLRGFFESQRRHIAFEREHLLPRIGMRRPG